MTLSSLSTTKLIHPSLTVTTCLYEFVKDGRHLLVVFGIDRDFFNDFLVDVVLNRLRRRFSAFTAKLFALCLHKVKQGEVVEFSDFTAVVRFDVRVDKAAL